LFHTENMKSIDQVGLFGAIKRNGLRGDRTCIHFWHSFAFSLFTPAS